MKFGNDLLSYEQAQQFRDLLRESHKLWEAIRDVHNGSDELELWQVAELQVRHESIGSKLAEAHATLIAARKKQLELEGLADRPTATQQPLFSA